MTSLGALRSDGAARWLFIWPTVLFILTLSLFPLVASVALSLSKLTFRKGGIDLTWVGFSNYQSLLFGLERSHFLGVLKTPNPIGWAIVDREHRPDGLGMDARRPKRAVRAVRSRPSAVRGRRLRRLRLGPRPGDGVATAAGPAR